MAQLLGGKVAIITGGLRGLGRTTATTFAREGAQVGVLDLDDERDPAVKELLGEVGRSNRRGVYHQADVTSLPVVRGAVDRIVATFDRVDVLVNNAGGGMPPVPLEDLEEADWDRIVALNLRSVYVCSRAVIAVMKRQRAGRIINISSQAGRSKSELSNVPYASAKAGVLGFTRQLAREVGPFGITVNAIAPGVTLSGARVQARWEERSEDDRRQMLAAIPLGRLGRPEDIAEVAAFLASDRAGYLTGATIDVNGGRFML